VYVLVSGLPGSGKSTIARPLAQQLGLPLLARDDIKESLWDALGPGDVAWSRRLGAASAEVFLRLAQTAGTAVLDNFFHADRRADVAALGGPLVEVHCACPVEIARMRYTLRQRHACHFDAEYGLPAFDRWVRNDREALGLGPVLEVDTSQPADVDAIARWVRANSRQ
jgi:predicted kinase